MCLNLFLDLRPDNVRAENPIPGAIPVAPYTDIKNVSNIIQVPHVGIEFVFRILTNMLHSCRKMLCNRSRA
jgi:hypothetical protein